MGKYIQYPASDAGTDIVKDYEKQRAQGLNPLFDPATVGIEDEAGVWNQYVEEKKKRGDYENPALGYEKKN